MQFMAGPVVIFSVLAFVAFLIWNRTRASLERRQLQLDAQARVLERIGSGPELTEFLRTDDGRKFMSQLAAGGAEPARGKDVRGRILVLTAVGFVALIGGIFFVAAALIPNLLAADPEMPLEIMTFMALPAFFLTGGGLGALIAAWLMHRLAKKWGTLEARPAGDGVG